MFTGARRLTLKEVLAKNIKLPACPGVTAKLAPLLAQADCEGDKVSKIVSSDPSLTTQVLKVANSAFYGMPRRLRSVDEAIVRLGFREISSIVSALEAKTLFKSTEPKWSGFNEALYLHVLATAILVKALGKRINPAFCDAFFTAGMLHDLGKLILQQYDPNYMTLCGAGAIHGSALCVLEEKTYGTTHAMIAGELLRFWNLPETLVKLVEGHHDRVAEGDRVENVRSMVNAANDIAHVVAPLGAKEISFNLALPDQLLRVAGLDLRSWAMVGVDCQRSLGALIS